jgi:tRNA pseudouridine38-40 synthase
MRNIKFVISYDGIKFKGWQKLGEDKRTLQGTLEKILSTVLKEEIQVIGCGRTDAGVHAISYVLNFHTESTMPIEEVVDQFTKQCPQDIQLIESKDCGERFHARYNVKQKTYLYKIDNKELCNLFTRHYKMHVPESLDLKKMKEVANLFEGEHDFQSFTTLKTKTKSTVRTIKKIDMEENEGNLNIRITGEGFLWNMVRIIVATLLAVGKNQLTIEEVKVILQNHDKVETPGKVDARALYLESVEY